MSCSEKPGAGRSTSVSWRARAISVPRSSKATVLMTEGPTSTQIVTINHEARAKHNAAQHRNKSTQHINEKFGREAGEFRKGNSFLVSTWGIEMTPGGIFVQDRGKETRSSPGTQGF